MSFFTETSPFLQYMTFCSWSLQTMFLWPVNVAASLVRAALRAPG